MKLIELLHESQQNIELSKYVGKKVFNSLDEYKQNAVKLNDQYREKGFITSTIISDWPNVVDNFSCKQLGLKSLIGGPSIVREQYDAGNNILETFEGFPKSVAYLRLTGNHTLSSLHNIHMHVHYCEYMSLPSTISSHIMGLMKIKGLDSIQVMVTTESADMEVKKLRHAVEILNRHLDGRGNFFDCLEELEDAGLEEFAQL